MRLLEANPAKRGQDSFLPGLEFGNVWFRAAAAKRDDRFSATHSARGRKSLRALDDAYLSRRLPSLRPRNPSGSQAKKVHKCIPVGCA